MKKLILSLLTVLLPLVAFADAVEIDGIYYDLVTKAKEAIVTKNPNKYSGSVNIPASVTYNGVEYSVTSISEYAFSNSELTSVTIPNSVTSISNYAFCKSRELTSVTIPNSVTSIGIYSFDNCNALTSVLIGDGLTSISGGAFHCCSALTSVTIPENVTLIDYEAFEGCSGLTSINLPNSLTRIGSLAFNGCAGLNSITIPNSLKSIGYQAFNGCNGLTRVNITDLAAWCGISFFVESDGSNHAYHLQRDFTCNPLFIAKHLYLNDVEITELEIPDDVTSIRDAAFVNNSQLTSVTFPQNNNLWVGKYAFYECTGLTSVNIKDLASWCSVHFEYASSSPLYYAQKLYLNGNEVKDLIIPDGETTIRQYAFFGCAGLLSASIPSSVQSIEERAFYGCNNLTTLTISDGLNSIGKSAFNKCSSLTSISIPNSVISIGESAFSDCSNLTSLALPNNLYTIEALSFSGCGMTTVTIPDGVANIGASAFSNCKNLGIVIIGGGVRKIENMAFSSCPEITDVYCYAERVPEVTYWAFQDSYIDYATLHVPANSLEAYKAQSPWNTFKDIVPLDGQSIETLEYTSPTDRIDVYSIDGKFIGSATNPSDASNITNLLPSGTTVIIKKGEKSVKAVVK